MRRILGANKYHNLKLVVIVLYVSGASPVWVSSIRYGGPSEETNEDYRTYTMVGHCEVEAMSQSGRSALYFIDP
jgi:hypothetical protein